MDESLLMMEWNGGFLATKIRPRDRIGRPRARIDSSQPEHNSTSVTVSADRLAPLAGAQGPPGRQADRVLDELDRAVAEDDIDATRVVARRRGDPIRGV